MSDTKAIEQGYTHAAKMYGINGYFRDYDNGFVAKYKLTDLIFECILYFDMLFPNDEGFKIVILEEL